MKAIFVGPQGIRAGWRFAIFVFLLFGLSNGLSHPMHRVCAHDYKICPYTLQASCRVCQARPELLPIALMLQVLDMRKINVAIRLGAL